MTTATASPASLTQLDLLPAERLVITDRAQPIDRLPPDADLAGPPPTRELVDSVRRWGVLEPLVFRAAGGGIDWGDPRSLISGRRRLKAVRLLQAEAKADMVRASQKANDATTRVSEERLDLGHDPTYRAAYERFKEWQTVPVRLVSDPEGTPDDPSGPVLTLLSNAVRRENPVTDLAMLERLLERATKQELGERQALTEIGRATGLSVPTIKQRLRLRSLTPSLRRLFDTNRLSYTVALEASRLPVPAQDRLLGALKDGEALTVDDVKAARKGDVEAVRQLALGDVFPDETAPAPIVALPARPLRQRADALIAQLRETRLPICREAAALLEEALG